jgi:hypothetical protein
MTSSEHLRLPAREDWEFGYYAAEASQPVEPTMCTKNSIQAEEPASVKRTRMKVRVVGETQSAKVIMAPARRSHPNTLGVHLYLVAIRTLDSA